MDQIHSQCLSWIKQKSRSCLLWTLQSWSNLKGLTKLMKSLKGMKVQDKTSKDLIYPVVFNINYFWEASRASVNRAGQQSFHPNWRPENVSFAFRLHNHTYVFNSSKQIMSFACFTFFSSRAHRAENLFETCCSVAVINLYRGLTLTKIIWIMTKTLKISLAGSRVGCSAASLASKEKEGQPCFSV